MEATAFPPSSSRHCKRKTPSASLDSSGVFSEQPRKRVVSSCKDEDSTQASVSNENVTNHVERAKMSRSIKSFKNLLSCSTISSSSSSSASSTASSTASFSNAKSHSALPSARPSNLVSPSWEDGGCVSDDSASFDGLSVAGTNCSSFAPADSTASVSEACSGAGSVVGVVSNVASPTSATKVPAVGAVSSTENQPSLNQWGWFVKMDSTSLDNRPLVSYPKRNVSFDDLKSTVRLAFVTDSNVASSANHNEQQEDATLRWATAADTVDEVLGGLDIPEL